MWMPGTLTTTYGNRANDRQIEIYEGRQIFRHFFCRQTFWCAEFVHNLQKSRTPRDFSPENHVSRSARNVHKYFLDGKIFQRRDVCRGKVFFFGSNTPGLAPAWMECRSLLAGDSEYSPSACGPHRLQAGSYKEAVEQTAR